MPQLLDDIHRVAHRLGCGRPQPQPFGVQAIQLGLDQRDDLHAIDAQPVDRPVDVGVKQQDATHPGTAEIHLAEGRAGHRQIDELRSLVVGLLHESRHRLIVGTRYDKIDQSRSRRYAWARQDPGTHTRARPPQPRLLRPAKSGPGLVPSIKII